MDVTIAGASRPLAAAPARSSGRTWSAAGARRAMTRRRRPRDPGVPVILNAPQQFGTSFRYPDGTWFHGE